MYVQLHIEDTDAFKELEALKEKRLAETEGSQVLVKRSPVLEAIARYPKRITLAAGAFISVQVNFYILIGFILAYGSDPAGGGMSRDMVLAAVLVASAIQVPTQFWASSYSDRHGRRGIFMLGAALTGLRCVARLSIRCDRRWCFCTYHCNTSMDRICDYLGVSLHGTSFGSFDYFRCHAY